MSRSEWTNLGCVIRKMPPRAKILADIRERECREQIRDAVAALDINKTSC